VDELLDENIKNEIILFGQKKDFSLIIRDKQYAIRCSDLEKPIAFISHDSRDKDTLVRDLASKLSELLIPLPIWYDEYSLKIGDSLRESIEKGLREAKKCIIVLSPNYLSNKGWSKTEFNSVFTREILEKENVILPIWHQVSVQEVYKYSPILADKVGLSSSIGIEKLATKLMEVIKK